MNFKSFSFRSFMQLSCFMLLFGLFSLAPNTASAQVIIVMDGGCSATYQQSQVEIYFSPNPADDILSVGNNIGLRMNTLIIKDLEGNTVLSREVNAVNTTLDVSTVPSGNYTLTISTDCGSGSAQLVISH